MSLKVLYSSTRSNVKETFPLLLTCYHRLPPPCNCAIDSRPKYNVAVDLFLCLSVPYGLLNQERKLLENSNMADIFLVALVSCNWRGHFRSKGQMSKSPDYVKLRGKPPRSQITTCWQLLCPEFLVFDTFHNFSICYKLFVYGRLHSRMQTYIFSSCFFLLLFSSPNLSGRSLDVYHTSTHGVALVRI